MKKSKLKESKGKTYFLKSRGMPTGCQLCLVGAKAVLFLNGICQNPFHCSWYCPISNKRKNKRDTYADEINISTKSELIEEINKIKAKGMSITGGEPLLESNLEKTIDFIKYIKSKKGKKFHIHLYTNGINFNENIATKLSEAGLDEIRFHPSKDNWKDIEKALYKGMIVGAEVPVIPQKKYIQELEEFILYLDKIGADFINLNEFEYCFPNSKVLKEKGFKLKKNTMAAVENSSEFAFDLIKRIESKVSLKIHFCTIVAKDYYQLRNRYLRRAKSIVLPYEAINDEGLLVYALIEGDYNDLESLFPRIQTIFKLSEEFLTLEHGVIKLPVQVALEDDFIKFLDENNLQCYIEEIIPFRGKYCQITERTPVKVFIEELKTNEN